MICLNEKLREGRTHACTHDRHNAVTVPILASGSKIRQPSIMALLYSFNFSKSIMIVPIYKPIFYRLYDNNVVAHSNKCQGRFLI